MAQNNASRVETLQKAVELIWQMYELLAPITSPYYPTLSRAYSYSDDGYQK